MKIYNLKNIDATLSTIKELTKLHVEAFPEFFLSQLGEKFLSVIYKGYLEDMNSGIIVARESEKIVGFIAYSNDYSGFFKKLIRRHIFYLGWCSCIVAIKHPLFVKRLFGALKKGEEVKRNEAYVELASICVAPSNKNNGIGSRLIHEFIEMIDFNKYAYINLETDAVDNECVNAFYKKNGFKLVRTYVTPEGRMMNEYHYYK